MGQLARVVGQHQGALGFPGGDLAHRFGGERKRSFGGIACVRERIRMSAARFGIVEGAGVIARMEQLGHQSKRLLQTLVVQGGQMSLPSGANRET